MVYISRERKKESDELFNKISILLLGHCSRFYGNSCVIKNEYWRALKVMFF